MWQKITIVHKYKKISENYKYYWIHLSFVIDFHKYVITAHIFNYIFALMSHKSNVSCFTNSWSLLYIETNIIDDVQCKEGNGAFLHDCNDVLAFIGCGRFQTS